jgi:nucleoside-diphosphate-sugar epimerase
MEPLKLEDGLEKMPVLVTGASGFVGSHLVEHLLARGANVTALARSKGRLSLLKPTAQFNFYSCDISQYDEVAEIMSDVRPEVVFHFASFPDGAETFEHMQDCVDANLNGTVNLLEAFRKRPGKLFIYGDSCKVYGNSAVPYREDQPLNPQSSYAMTKAAGWWFCQLYASVHGVPVTSVRPTMIYGPRQSFNLITYLVDCVLQEQREIRLAGGAQTRDPLFIEDAVDAILRLPALAERVKGRAVNVGGGCERTVVEIAKAVVEIMRSDALVVAVPAAIRPTEMLRSYCDNAEAGYLLDWHPRQEFTSGLRLTIAELVRTRTPRCDATEIAS